MSGGSSRRGQRASMSRATRTVRGSAGALAATLLAAASHGLAGGAITWLAVVATAILALPLCVALAGRIGSLWRLGIAVAISQFLYHWSFAGLGSGIASASSAAPQGVHGAHLQALLAFSPDLAAAGAADASMWLAHTAAAAVTVALLHGGERGFLQLARTLRRALPLRIPTLVPVPRRTDARGLFDLPALRSRLCGVTAITHRGPPAASALSAIPATAR